MVDTNYVQLRPLTREEFEYIHEILKNDSSVEEYVHFSYHSLVTNGIFYKNKLVGVFNLSYFIENSIALSIALLEDYRKLGIAKVTFDKITRIYGEQFPKAELFIANVSPNNTNAIEAFGNMGLNKTHQFDEMLLEEGAEFFSIFYKENPYRKLVKND